MSGTAAVHQQLFKLVRGRHFVTSGALCGVKVFHCGAGNVANNVDHVGHVGVFPEGAFFPFGANNTLAVVIGDYVFTTRDDDRLLSCDTQGGAAITANFMGTSMG